MLRSSVSKAFRGPEGKIFSDRDPAGRRRRPEAIRQLFHDLYASFAKRLSELERAIADAARRPTASGGAAESGPLRLGKERSLLEGIEFVLETPEASWRFVDRLDGVLQVDRVAPAGLEPVEWIGVMRSGGTWSPVSKVILPPVAGRIAFRRTSIPEIVRRYLPKCLPGLARTSGSDDGPGVSAERVS